MAPTAWERLSERSPVPELNGQEEPPGQFRIARKTGARGDSTPRTTDREFPESDVPPEENGPETGNRFPSVEGLAGSTKDIFRDRTFRAAEWIRGGSYS